MLRPVVRLAVLGLASLPFAAPADDSVPARARAVFEHNKESVVKVTGVAQVRLSAAAGQGLNLPEQENKVRTDGTVVDDRGLIVVSLSGIDPSRLIDGREANSPMGRIKVDASATLKELEIILGDGTEIPATMVFKDADLDLAFVRPKADAPEAKGVTFDPVDLAAAGTAETADYTVTVGRLEEIFNNEPALLPGQVSAVLERPRRLYLGANIGRGCPMFTLDGKLLGIGGLRTSTMQGQGLVVVPAAEVQKLVAQIPTGDAAEAAVSTDSAAPAPPTPAAP
jgi:hypothetical protein